ncbi:MAG: response regulator [Pseudomonas sp.]
MLRVLVIEDSPQNSLLIKTVLELARHTVLQAATAAEGLALARAERPDIIVSDILLPDMSGLELAQILKADPSTRAIPLLALTALAMQGDRERVLAAGLDAYLSKPFDYKELLAELERLTKPLNSRPG